MSDERAGLDLPLCHKLYNARPTCHPFTPNTDELKVIITAIEDSILEDPERFDVMAWEENNRDFYYDLNNDRDDR